MKNKEFIDYIINDQCKMLISEFYKDLEQILWDKIHLVDVMEKWEAKLK